MNYDNKNMAHDSLNMTDQIVQNARELFTRCDTNGHGYLSRKDLERLQDSLHLNEDQLDSVFTYLDKDENGELTFEEFVSGIGPFLLQKSNKSGTEVTKDVEEDSEEQFRQAFASLGSDEIIKNYEQVKRIWKHLSMQHSNLLPDFEKIITRVAKEIEVVRADYQNMERLLQEKTMEQEEKLRAMIDELEQQLSQEKENIRRQGELKEKEIKEQLLTRLGEKDHYLIELMHQFEDVSNQLEQIQKLQTQTTQEKDKLLQEKRELQKQLEDSQTMLSECKEYIQTLQNKVRENRRQRARAAMELSEGIALERETLVRQLDTLRSINKKLMDEQDSKLMAMYHMKQSGVPTDLAGLDLDPTNNLRGQTLRLMLESSSDADETQVFPSSQANLDIRRGSTMSKYFSPVLSSQNTVDGELEGIAEAEETEEVFDENMNGNRRQNGKVYHSGFLCEPAITAITSNPKQSKSNMTKTDRIYKIIFVGESQVGKSSLIIKFVTGEFNPCSSCTVAIDFHVKRIQYDGVMLILQIWDTAGQEQFRSLTRQYYRKSDGVIIVYDCTDPRGFALVRSWLQSIRDETDDGTVMMILSNKHDLVEPNDENVTERTKSARRIATEYTTELFEVSAKTGQNIQEAFQWLSRKLIEREDRDLENGLILKEVKTNKKTCCH